MEENQITRSNQEVCPNCLEPNDGDLANCAFCGMPLHNDPESVNAPLPGESGLQTIAAEESGNPSGAPDSETEPQEESKDKKKGRGFTYAMRGMGLYLIVYAISELPRSFKIEEPQNRTLAVVGDVIYLVAGCLMAWPLLKDYLDKRKEKQQSAAADDKVIEYAEPAADESNVIEIQPAAEVPDETHPEKADTPDSNHPDN